MATVRCPYCHKDIDKAKYRAHEAKHLKTLEDGQQTDYATLPEEERRQGSLKGVPRVYRHKKCRTETEMPEEIIRSYLENPYLYLADATFCCGCEKHVPFKECKWTETGQNVQQYMDELREERPDLRPGLFKRMLVAIVKRFQ